MVKLELSGKGLYVHFGLEILFIFGFDHVCDTIS